MLLKQGWDWNGLPGLKFSDLILKLLSPELIKQLTSAYCCHQFCLPALGSVLMRNLRLQGELSVWNPHWYHALCTVRPNSDAVQPWVQCKHLCLEHFAFTPFPDRGVQVPALGLHSSVWKGRDESTDASVCPHQTLTPPLPQSVLPLAPCPVQVPSSDFPNLSHFSVQLTSLSNLSLYRPVHMCLVPPGCICWVCSSWILSPCFCHH